MKKKRLISRRAQITVFMIIGVILLFSSALVIYVRQSITEAGISLPRARIAEVPLEVRPVAQIISGCIGSELETALKLVGLQGGYINPASEDLSWKITTISTESDALLLAGPGSAAIPYWFYLVTDNRCRDCAFDSKRPFLHKREGSPSIEREIDRYIENNIDLCIDNSFAELEQQGFSIVKKSSPQADTSVGRDRVETYLAYDVELRKEETAHSVERFYSFVEIDLQRYYNIATELTNLQKNRNFLEMHVQNLIAGFASLDRDKIPPLFAVDNDCNQMTWVKFSVEQKIVPMLNSYVSALQVGNTLNFRPVMAPDDQLKRAIYANMVVPLEKNDPWPLAVHFTYLNKWPIYFDITPRDGQMIRPDSINIPLLIDTFCMNTYKFGYDISYPVLVTIHDEEALRGQGYTFQFALEGNLRDNTWMNLSFIKDLQPPSPIYDLGERELCRADQRQGRDIVITVKDDFTGEPIEGANVKFCIPGYGGRCDEDTCNMGSTDAEGILVTKFPPGIGLVIISKSGYQDYQTGFSFPSPKDIDASMFPKTEIEVEIKKVMLEKQCTDVDKASSSFLKKASKEPTNAVAYSAEIYFPDNKNLPDYTWFISPVGKFIDVMVTDSPSMNLTCLWELNFDSIEDARDDDEIIINFERVPQGYEKAFSAFYAKSSGVPGDTIELIPGMYHVTADVIANRKISIPEEYRKSCGSGVSGFFSCMFMSEDEQYITLDAMELDAFPSGGLVFEDDGGKNRPFGIARETLMHVEDKKMVFYIPAIDADSMDMHEDLGMPDLVRNNLTKHYRAKLNPVIS